VKGFEVRACGCDCAPNVCLRRSRASYVCVCVCRTRCGGGVAERRRGFRARGENPWVAGSGGCVTSQSANFENRESRIDLDEISIRTLSGGGVACRRM
jgi:hypothetical protein